MKNASSMSWVLGSMWILCAPGQARVQADAGAIAGHQHIKVSVDPRVELMSIIFQLAGNPEYNRSAGYAYAEEVNRHFAAHRNHDVVKTARQLRRDRGVSYDAVMSMAFHVENPETLAERTPFDRTSKGLDSRWHPAEARRFLKQARQFVQDSNFQSFVRQHRKLYEKTETRLRAKLKERAYLDWFEGFFGDRPRARFHAVAGMLTGPNNYGTTVHMPNHQEDIYQVLGVYTVDARGVPEFPESLVPIVVHEFCHAYVNPIVYAHAGELRDAGEQLYARVEKAMSRQAYGNWQTMMHESVVRACVIRYLLHTDGAGAARKQVLAEQSRSFLWTGELVELLAQYESRRDTFPDLTSFFPKIIAFFNDYVERHRDTLTTTTAGPINAVFEHRGPDSMVVVMPDHIKDPQLAGRVGRFVRGIHGEFFQAQQVPLVSASDVDQAALKSKALVLYGSPDSNPVLADIAAKCGIRITRDVIGLPGREFNGRNLVLITCFPNPYNPQRPVLLYSAAEDRNIIEINTFFHGPTDYVIGRWDAARRPQTLHQGHYTKMPDGRWQVAP